MQKTKQDPVSCGISCSLINTTSIQIKVKRQAKFHTFVFLEYLSRFIIKFINRIYLINLIITNVRHGSYVLLEAQWRHFCDSKNVAIGFIKIFLKDNF